MYFTRTQEYGILFLRELIRSRKESSEYLPVSVISKKYRVSSIFLNRIAKKLCEKKMVESREGNRGGYRIKNSTKKITLDKIFQALESNSFFYQNCPIDCSRRDICRYRTFLNKLQREVFRQLRQIRL